MLMAEEIVEKILEAGARHEYEKYLRPKIKPYTALNVIEENCQVLQVSVFLFLNEICSCSKCHKTLVRVT